MYGLDFPNVFAVLKQILLFYMGPEDLGLTVGENEILLRRKGGWNNVLSASLQDRYILC